MKNLTFLLALQFISFVGSTQTKNDSPVLGTYVLPEKGFETATFGACSLYQLPSAKSTILAELPINSTVIIDTAIEVNYELLNNRPEFYKVRYNNKVGYVPSAELAYYRLLQKDVNRTFLFWYNMEPEQKKDETDAIEYTAYHYNLFYKVLNQNTVVEEGTFDLNDDLFQLFLMPPKGLSGISKLFVIDYFSEACGEDGGQDYYSWKPGEFNFIAHLSEVGDGGVFYFTEKFIFPTDSSGVKNQVRYESEEFELFDEETNWYSEVRKFRTYEWKDGALYPSFKREYKYEEEVESEE